jgi:Ca2+-binding EF-hand superfamily protein
VARDTHNDKEDEVKPIASLFVVITALAATLAWAQGQQPPQDPAQAFIRNFDTDKDGKVSKAEFLKPAEAQFDKMDRNGDGFIAADEARAAAEEQRRRMEQMRQQQGRQRR